MTFSEFGRRIRSNDSNGTDHGTAAPMMFFGSCVNAGIIGESPLIPDDPGGGDGVPMQFDFRSVYSSILTDWFDITPDTVSSIMGESFPNIPIVKSCSEVSTATSDLEVSAVSLNAYPNPFENWLQIDITVKVGKVRLSLFDAIGHEIDVIESRSMSEGSHLIKFDGSHLIPGNYFLKVSSEWGVKTIGVVKV